MKSKIAISMIYLMCSFCAWGVATGDVQCYQGDMNSVYLAGGLALLGPVGAVEAVGVQMFDDFTFGNGFHFALRPFSQERRWQIFHAKYPNLSRYYFEHGHEESDRCDCDK